ncbi:protein BIC1-like [Telopea speciosissima]|uniref:protein BIC1-like n=1 Tax=Telopea speciosissima TaxID=54955 RepID=UPI001CC3D133|nr:protein BIC1-like [Telopea speciosissima]
MSDQIPSTPSKPNDSNDKQSSIQQDSEEDDSIELQGKDESEPEDQKQVKLQGQYSSSTTVVVMEVEKEDHKNSKEEEEEEEEVTAENSGRERLKKHRKEVAGSVWIPEIWGKEEFLKDWMDCSAFNASLVPSGIMSARAALIEEGQQPNSGGGGGLRIENNRCPVILSSSLRR